MVWVFFVHNTSMITMDNCINVAWNSVTKEIVAIFHDIERISPPSLLLALDFGHFVIGIDIFIGENYNNALYMWLEQTFTLDLKVHLIYFRWIGACSCAPKVSSFQCNFTQMGFWRYRLQLFEFFSYHETQSSDFLILLIIQTSSILQKFNVIDGIFKT